MCGGAVSRFVSLPGHLGDPIKIENVARSLIRRNKNGAFKKQFGFWGDSTRDSTAAIVIYIRSVRRPQFRTPGAGGRRQGIRVEGRLVFMANG